MPLKQEHRMLQVVKFVVSRHGWLWMLINQYRLTSKVMVDSNGNARCCVVDTVLILAERPEVQVALEYDGTSHDGQPCQHRCQDSIAAHEQQRFRDAVKNEIVAEHGMQLLRMTLADLAAQACELGELLTRMAMGAMVPALGLHLS